MGWLRQEGSGLARRPGRSIRYERTFPRRRVEIYYDNNGTSNRAYQVEQVDAVGGSTFTTFTYTRPTSGSGGTTVVTDPNNHATTIAYDIRDRITQTTDPLGRTTSTSYDTTGSCGATDDDRVCSTTDTSGAVSNFSYSGSSQCAGTPNTRNNLCKTQGPLNSSGQRPTSSYGYADSNNPYSPSAYTDQGARTWSATYDSTTGDQLTKAEGDAPGQNPVTFAYNSDGTAKSITDAKGTGNSACPITTVTICFAYDTNHNLQTTTYPAPLGTEQFTWDSLNRMASITDGKSQQTTYTYDGADIQHSMDRLKTVTFAGAGGTVTWSSPASVDTVSLGGSLVHRDLLVFGW